MNWWYRRHFLPWKNVFKYQWHFMLILAVLSFFGIRGKKGPITWQQDDGSGLHALVSYKLLEICSPLTESLKAELVKERASYVEQSKYLNKIAEARGERNIDSRGRACLQFLRERVLAKGQSVLDLGCAAGAALKNIQMILKDFGGYGALVGVELVPGWITEAKKIFNDTMQFYNSDITEFSLPDETFDVITLHDVIEHIQPERYGCLFQALQRLSRPGTAVYFHVPSPEAQLEDDGQFFENVLPHHVLVQGMAMAHFQLEYFGYDSYTDCGDAGQLDGVNTRNIGMKCLTNGVPRYSHFLFRYTEKQDVFTLKRKSKAR